MKRIKNTVFNSAVGPMVIWIGILHFLWIALIILLAIYIVSTIKNSPENGSSNSDELSKDSIDNK